MSCEFFHHLIHVGDGFEGSLHSVRVSCFPLCHFLDEINVLTFGMLLLFLFVMRFFGFLEWCDLTVISQSCASGSFWVVLVGLQVVVCLVAICEDIGVTLVVLLSSVWVILAVVVAVVMWKCFGCNLPFK